LKYTKQEEESIRKLTSTFEFETEENHADIILIGADTGEGKTHLACTMSEVMPVAIGDTEMRASIVTNKFKDSAFPIQRKTIRTYLETLSFLYAAIKYFKTLGKKGCIVLDSVTEVQQFAEEYYKEVAKLEKVWPQYLWAQIYSYCDNIIKIVKDSGNTLVMTSKVKEKYVNDKPTGELVYRTYHRYPYLSDIAFMLDHEKPLLRVTKDGYWQDLKQEIPRTLSLPQIIEVIKSGKP